MSQPTRPAHPSHPDVDRRLARIAGHVEAIRRMLAAEKPCHEILQQMKAVLVALENTRRIVLMDHVHHCIGDAIRQKQATAAVEEIEHLLTQLW
ncbi:MAG: hypothetical protein OZSIB_2800 [Candidatus Ozemobacter sibiricus]|jgi:DNA-binding FrmR family transcriptional regulator|uniref:Cytosolic protein n=1 Tax=Candidatus Ozemobacter sibiricus TaxID=2268124 RepID=A0A367ZU79_9BACT|nr:MAG: hypothetical protein OZSIB_2800 [Candidatus Ozemobacter sibiricus]